MGKTPDRKKLDYFQGSHKWISIADISKSEKYISETKECLSDEAITSSGIKSIPKDTLIMSFKLSIGKTAITSDEMYSNEAIMAFLPNGKCETDNSFLYHLFSNKDWSEGSNKAVKGITLNKASLSEAKIPLPPLEEQKQIAAQLDKCTALIAKHKLMLEKYDTLIKSRFIEMFGDPDTNPKRWNIKTLNEVCRKITDGKHGGCKLDDKSDYYYVGAREIFDLNIHYETAQKITKEDFEKDYKRCNLEIGDFCIVNTGATIGKTAIAKDERTTHTLLQKSVALLKVNPEEIIPIYLQYSYITNESMYKVESASAQPNLLLSKIRETKLMVPPIAIQNDFAAFVQQIDKSKFAVQKSLNKAEILYKSLMQEYFG